MSEAEWGIKRQCPECAVWFYDLKKVPITCPGCERTFEASSFLKLKNSRSEYSTPVRRVEEAVSFKDDVASDDDSDAIIESTDDLVDGDDIVVVKPKDDDEDTDN